MSEITVLDQFANEHSKCHSDGGRRAGSEHREPGILNQILGADLSCVYASAKRNPRCASASKSSDAFVICRRGTIQCGSILINEMTIAGA